MQRTLSAPPPAYSPAELLDARLAGCRAAIKDIQRIDQIRAQMARTDRAEELLRWLWMGVLAYKRFRPHFLLWLERAQHRLGAYGPGGVARERDLQAFVLALPDLAGPQSGPIPTLLAPPADGTDPLPQTLQQGLLSSYRVARNSLYLTGGVPATSSIVDEVHRPDGTLARIG